jgi:hypothetical protein
VRKVLHAGVSDRPRLLTGPALGRTPCSPTAARWWGACMRGGGPGREDGVSEVRGPARSGGDSVGTPTPGRHGHAPPPGPLRATRGGAAAQGEGGAHGPAVPYAWLRRTGQGPLRSRCRPTRTPDRVTRLGDAWCQPSPTGLGPTGHQGQGPAQEQRWATDVAPDGVRPPSSVRRREREEGERGPSHDRSHSTERVERAALAVDTWLGRLMPPTMPTGGKRLRSDGVQATKT